MKKIYSGLVLAVIVALFIMRVVFPAFAFADQTQGTNVGSGQQQGPSTATISNPLKVNSIEDFISTALNFVVNVLAVAAACYIMWAGFLFVKAQGNPEELKTAKTALVHALIGTALVLGAWGLATVISNTVNKVTNNNNVILKPIQP